MPYVNVPNDLSKIKTKIAFNLTKRQFTPPWEDEADLESEDNV